MGLARGLPRQAGLKVFEGVGVTAGCLFRKDRQRAMENLEIAFPDMAPPLRVAMVRAMFRALGRNTYEFLTLAGSSRERLSGLIDRVEGRQYFDAAVEKGHGVIAITGHIGCWELLAAYFASEGYPVSVVGRTLWNSRINRDLLRIRESVGYRTIDRDRGGKEMMRVLHDRKVLAMLIDQHTRVNGVYVPFFNRPAHTPTGAARLAQRTGAVIVPTAIYMTPPGKHLIRVLAPIEPSGSPDRDEEIRVVTERCSEAIEELVRFDPKQWVWFHRRWRDRGENRVGYATVN